MSIETEGYELEGGNTNTVVKVGNTVRRQTGPQSKTIHKFLQHLETKKVATSRYLGIDELGRETLSYIEGKTDFPETLWKDEAWLINSGQLLRKFHDASTDFDFSKHTDWAFSYPDRNKHEVINHNDFAPYNMVFHPNAMISIIDCDLSGPGPRERDLAYLAYWMSPLSFGPNSIETDTAKDLIVCCDRLRTLCQAYGFGYKSSQLLPMVSEVLWHMGNEKAVAMMVGKEVAARLKSGGHFRHWKTEAIAFDRKYHDLMEILK